MQFDATDRKRYASIFSVSNATGKSAISDLSRYVKNETAMHCPGSGYRVEKKGHAPVDLAGACGVLSLSMWSGKTVVATRPRSGQKGSRKRKRSQVQEFDNGRSYFGSARGLARGKDVHEEVANFVMWDFARFKACYGKVDPMTKSVLTHLYKLSYTGVHAEYIVYDTFLRSGTAVDLICLDRTGRLVFVELKTGYQGVFSKHRSNMKAPFGEIPDSPLNRARSQLLFAMTLYMSNHKSLPVGRVVHVDSSYRTSSFGMGPLIPSANNRQSMRHVIADAKTQREAQKAAGSKKGRPM